MNIKKKSTSIRFLEKLRGGRLTFGRMIESLRLADEISQIDLAKYMKMSRAQLCDIEKGRRIVSPERAAEFAKVMRYSIEQFVAVAIEDQLRHLGLKYSVELSLA